MGLPELIYISENVYIYNNVWSLVAGVKKLLIKIQNIRERPWQTSDCFGNFRLFKYLRKFLP